MRLLPSWYYGGHVGSANDENFFNTVWKRSEWTSASALYVVVDNFVCSSTHV